MNTNRLTIGGTPSRVSCELQVTTHALPAWAPDFPAGAGASLRTHPTASLSSGILGDPSARFQPVEDTTTETDSTDRPVGMVAGMVLLGATFTAGGLAGFLLALLLR